MYGTKHHKCKELREQQQLSSKGCQCSPTNVLKSLAAKMRPQLGGHHASMCSFSTAPADCSPVGLPVPRNTHPVLLWSEAATPTLT